MTQGSLDGLIFCVRLLVSRISRHGISLCILEARKATLSKHHGHGFCEDLLYTQFNRSLHVQCASEWANDGPGNGRPKTKGPAIYISEPASTIIGRGF